MAVLPSDHYFTDVEGFKSILKKTCEMAQQTDKLITIGIKPTFPATGYGYINFNKENASLFPAYEVDHFVEKPTFEKAKEFVNFGNYLWNSGMFAWKVSVIIRNATWCGKNSKLPVMSSSTSVRPR